MADATRVRESVRGAVKEVEAEVKRLIGYMNDEVVPEVRRSSSVGLRVAAEQLQRMAEHLDRASNAASRRASYTASSGPSSQSAPHPGAGRQQR